jgi:hypothetical protein
VRAKNSHIPAPRYLLYSVRTVHTRVLHLRDGKFEH